MNSKVLVCLVLATIVVYCDAHGRMMDPVNRGSAWRLYEFQHFPEARDKLDQEWCAYDNPNDPRSADRINARIRKSLKGLCKREGITKIHKMHDARRAFTQIAVDAKLNIQEISASLGHSNTAITHQYIGTLSNHVNPELEDILKKQLAL